MQERNSTDIYDYILFFGEILDEEYVFGHLREKYRTKSGLESTQGRSLK